MSGLDFSQKKKNFSEHCLSSQKAPILSAAMATQDPSPLSGYKQMLEFPDCTDIQYVNPYLHHTWLFFVPVCVSEW